MAQQGIKLLTSWTTAVKELVNCLSINIINLSIKCILFVYIMIQASIDLKCLSINIMYLSIKCILFVQASINLKCLSIDCNVYPYVLLVFMEVNPSYQ